MSQVICKNLNCARIRKSPIARQAINHIVKIFIPNEILPNEANFINYKASLFASAMNCSNIIRE